MKINSTLKNCVFSTALLLIISIANGQAPMFKFQNASLVSGTDRQVGATYRFPDVINNVDALVSITDITAGIVLTNIDRTKDGYSEAFQPEYKLSSLANAHIDFHVTFVKGGSNIPFAQPSVDATGLDIDGSSSGLLALKEFNTIDMGGGVCTFNSVASQLSIQKTGTAFTGNNITGFLFGALVDTAAYEVMFTVSKNNVTSFNYRIGAVTLLSSSSTRYASLYFKKFNYPEGSILPLSNLLSFKGTSNDARTKLDWSLTAGNNASTIVLERAYTAGNFQPVSQFWVNVDGHIQNEFTYTSNKSDAGSVYYRLKITGADGRVQYSNVLFFRGEQKENMNFAVYPSLVSSAVTAQFYSSAPQAASFEVFDYSGKLVHQQSLQLQQGQNNIRVSNLDGLPAGNYISTLKTSAKMYSCKINKL